MIKRIGPPFHQWELHRQIYVDVEFDKIHWYNKNMERALVTEPSSNTVNVPNTLLQSSEDICIYVIKDDKVIERTTFGVSSRKQPEDYIYTETEHFTYEEIKAEIQEVKNSLKCVELQVNNKIGGFTWDVDTDNVVDKTGKSYGSLADCMKEDFGGTWFYVRTTSSEAGSAAYPSKYTIDGANGYINLRDYVVWTGKRLVRVNTYEAKASTVKNSDGKYSPKSGVDGLMSSTDKAYLTDLINDHWDKKYLPIYPNPDPIEGWMCNWCRDDGIYLGGLKKDCGGHPPVLNDNHTSWVLMVFNGMATDHNTLNHNHRLQIAFDLVNSKIYMRRGWISSNEWADWSEVGKIADGVVDFNQLSERVINRITAAENKTDVVFVEERDETISLDENAKEVVVTSSNAKFNLLLPKNVWKYWRCIINLTDVEQVENMDVGYYNGGMFGIDAPWRKPSAGKTYLLVREGDVGSPSDFSLYEINNVTREDADGISNPDNSTEAKDNETWKNEPILTIEITEECTAVDVTEINGAPFAFERLGGYAEIVTNTNQEGRLCILLNRITGQSYNGLVCMNTNSSANAGNIQKGIFEVKREFGMWHTEDIATNTNSWLDLSSTKHEHWDSRGVFGSVDTITSFRLIPYTGVFNAGTVIKIYGKREKEATAI